VITEYAIRHPLAARVLERAFGYSVTRSAASRRAFADSVVLVAFRPRGTGEQDAGASSFA
jgi:hypothetical protein